jgi:DNA-binding PadR family transcriptional regulator
MERLGWLKGKSDPNGGRRARKDYRLTRDGEQVLEVLRDRIQELYEEVVGEAKANKRRRHKAGTKFQIPI